MNYLKSPILKTFILIILIQIVLLGLAVLAENGFEIPFVRQFLGFIYLTFIPGFLILRIIKIPELGWIKSLLYSIGISIAFVMMLGLFVNYFFPLVGIENPISLWPLSGTFTVAIVILSIIAFIREDNYSTTKRFNWSEILSPQVLFFILLPLLSIIGTRMVNSYHNNLILLILLPLIAIVPIVLTFTKLLNEKYYPFVIFSMALALLYHTSLISNYITGYDIHTEYYLAHSVILNSYWDTSIPRFYNAMLSIVLLAPTYNIICNLELTWIFKLIYPFIFSMVPLTIFVIVDTQSTKKMAFISATFFIFVNIFYFTMISLARQEIAELFLALVILVIIDKQVIQIKRSILMLLFGVSIIISHYAISYIFMLLLFVGYIVLIVYRFISKSSFLKKQPYSTNSISGDIHGSNNNTVHTTSNTITINFMILFIVAGLSWYIWNSDASIFSAIVELSDHIVRTFITEFMNPTSSEALWLISTPRISILHDVTKYMHFFTQFLITVGVLNLIFNWKNKIWDDNFASFSIVSFIILVAAIVVPNFAFALNTNRFYHLSLIVLSPFVVTGVLTIGKFIFKKIIHGEKVLYNFLSLFLALFFLMNTGFIYQVTKDHPFSISISQEYIKEHGNKFEKADFYTNYMPKENVFSAQWLSQNNDDTEDIIIYATTLDLNRVHPLISYGGIAENQIIPINDSTTFDEEYTYIYLQYLNQVENLGTFYSVERNELQLFDMSNIKETLKSEDRIYTNGKSNIFYIP